MTKHDYEQKQIRRCKEEWFKDHVARMDRYTNLRPGDELREIPVIDWRKKQGGSSYANAMRYIISGGTLIIIGDAGDAVFQWGERITLEFLAGCDLHYLAGKCHASEDGRKFTIWDRQVFGSVADSWMVEMGFSESAREAVLEAAITRDDLFMWLMDERWPRELRVLSQPEFKSTLLESGSVLHPRLIGMWVGIKMIHEQLTNNIATPADPK